MNGDDSLFEQMCNDAKRELAEGRSTWREMAPNTLILACFGFMLSALSRKITRPLWWFAGSTMAGALTYIVSLFLSNIG